MRDISAIRIQQNRREGKIEAPPKGEPILAIQSDNQDTQLLVQKTVLNQKLTKVVKQKRQELQITAEATTALLTNAQQEADRIVDDTRKKAAALISQAKTDLANANLLLENNKNKQRSLDSLETLLLTREKELCDKSKKVEEKEKVVHTKEENVDKLNDLALKRKEQSVDILANALALLELLFEQVNQVQNLNSEAEVKVSQTMSKTVTMMERISLLVKNLDADKSILATKAKELQEWQAGLVDREKMLERSTREVNNRK